MWKTRVYENCVQIKNVMLHEGIKHRPMCTLWQKEHHNNQMQYTTTLYMQFPSQFAIVTN